MTSRRLKHVAILTATAILAVLIVGGGWWAVSRYQATHGPECTVPRPSGGTVDPAGASEADGASGASSAVGGSSADDAVDAVDADDADTVDADGRPLDTKPLGMDAVQLQHASTINAVGLERGESPRARVIAVATAWQESSLRNINRGDRDSLGLFQQRPSQGWGDADQIMDPIYASSQFYNHLAKVRGWQEMSLAKAAQAVQRSGFPDAYAKWEWDALTLVDQLSGDSVLTLSCRDGAHASTVDAPVRSALAGTSGANPEITTLLAAAQAELAGLTVTQIPAGKTAASVTVTLPSAPNNVAARALAAWFIAHSASFGVVDVAVEDQLWTHHAWQPAVERLQPGAVTVSVTVTATA
ncbi:MAG: hypothetical protein ABI382_04620 [Nakamurella sp.]